MSTVLDLLQTAVDSNRQSTSPMTIANNNNNPPAPGPLPPSVSAPSSSSSSNNNSNSNNNSTNGNNNNNNGNIFSPTRQNFYSGSYFGQTSSFALRIANLPYDISNRELRLLFALSNDFLSCFISSMIINADGTRSGVVYFKSNQAMRKSFSLLNNRSDVFDGQQRPLMCEILSPSNNQYEENYHHGGSDSSNSSNGSTSPQNQQPPPQPPHTFRFFEDNNSSNNNNNNLENNSGLSTNANGTPTSGIGPGNNNGLPFNRGKNLLLESTDNDEIERIMNSRNFLNEEDDIPLPPGIASTASQLPTSTAPTQPISSTTPNSTTTSPPSSSTSTTANVVTAASVVAGQHSSTNTNNTNNTNTTTSTNNKPINYAAVVSGQQPPSSSTTTQAPSTASTNNNSNVPPTPSATSSTISHIPAVTTNDGQEIEQLISDGQGGKIVIPYSASTNSSTAVQVMQNGGRVLPPANPADQNPPCNTLYVGNIPPNTVEEELIALFSKQDGYRRLSFKVKNNGPMCFVEFSDVRLATKALSELYGYGLSNSVKGGLRLSFSKNPLGVRSERDKRKK